MDKWYPAVRILNSECKGNTVKIVLLCREGKIKQEESREQYQQDDVLAFHPLGFPCDDDDRDADRKVKITQPETLGAKKLTENAVESVDVYVVLGLWLDARE